MKLDRYKQHDRSVARRRFRTGRSACGVVLLLGVTMVLPGCGQDRLDGRASIKFTHVPLASAGGPNTGDVIAGRVSGAQPGQRVVLYARSGLWYVQPTADHPFTEIGKDSRWQNTTHLGSEYAALLVDPGFEALSRIEELPGEGNGVAAVVKQGGRPKLWQEWWVVLSVALLIAVAAALVLLMRLRALTKEMNVRFEERLAERTRIARELHDTLLQDFIGVSMQIHLANEQVPQDQPAKPLLNRSLELMGGIIQEGRHVLQGLGSVRRDSDDLERALARIPEELSPGLPLKFALRVMGVPRRLRPLAYETCFSIGQEAILGAYAHSRSGRVEVVTEYSRDAFLLRVRDNGFGMDALPSLEQAQEHSRVFRMRQRAERLGGTLVLRSEPHTERELVMNLPGFAAYEIGEANFPDTWLLRALARARLGSLLPHGRGARQ